ncbi:MAG: PKD domain-containing protein [Acidobacteriota bacterium]
MRKAGIIALFALAMLPLWTCEKSDPTAPDESTILLSANPDTIRPDTSGFGTSVITAQVLDGSFNAVKGVGVRFSASPTGSLTSNGDAVMTDSNGIARDTLKTNATTKVTARSGSATAEIQVAVGSGNKAPTVLLTAEPNPVKTGRNVTFDGSGSVDSDGSIIGYKWELYPDIDPPEKVPPDPTPYDPAVPSLLREYNQEQNVIVKLTVYDNSGAYDQDYIIENVVDNLPPTADAGADQRTKLPSSGNVTVKLDGSGSYDEDGSIVHYFWLCGNGTTYPTGTQQNPNSLGICSYNMTGQYFVTLTVTDDGGKESSDICKVTIE